MLDLIPGHVYMETERGIKFQPEVLLKGVGKPAIRRLARRGGCKRISHTIYPAAREVMTEWLHETLQHVLTYTEYGGRATVRPTEVILALKRMGRPILGYQSASVDKSNLPLMKADQPRRAAQAGANARRGRPAMKRGGNLFGRRPREEDNEEYDDRPRARVAEIVPRPDPHIGSVYEGRFGPYSIDEDYKMLSVMNNQYFFRNRDQWIESLNDNVDDDLNPLPVPHDEYGNEIDEQGNFVINLTAEFGIYNLKFADNPEA